MIVFCWYETCRRAIPRETARPIGIAQTASAQNQISRWKSSETELESSVSREHQERPDGDEVEDADDVVDRRVVGALLVPVVEPVDLRGDDPDRERQQEEVDLEAERHAARGLPAGDEVRDEEGGEQADDVREQERAADEPAAPPDDGGAAAVVDDLERPLVDDPLELARERVPGEHRDVLRGAHAGLGLLDELELVGHRRRGLGVAVAVPVTPHALT